MNVPFFGRAIDERFLNRRLKSTSLAGVIGGVSTTLLFAWRFYIDHIWSWDVLAIALRSVRAQRPQALPQVSEKTVILGGFRATRRVVRIARDGVCACLRGGAVSAGAPNLVPRRDRRRRWRKIARSPESFPKSRAIAYRRRVLLTPRTNFGQCSTGLSRR